MATGAYRPLFLSNFSLSNPKSLPLNNRFSVSVRSRYPSLPKHRISTSNPTLYVPRSGFTPRLLGGNLGFTLRASSNESDSVDEAEAAAEAEAKGQSTMPERFRYLLKEVPDRPVRWPWLIPVVFLVYAWRSVLWELSNWKKVFFALISFLGYLAKLGLAFIYQFIGDPITTFIACIEFFLYSLRSFYAGIVAFAPVNELTILIVLTSSVLAITEAVVPNAMNNQYHLLTLAGLIGLGALKGVITELFFWVLMVGLFCYSRFAKKRDLVSAALPSVATVVAVGEPWVRALVMVAYLGIAIVQHSKLALKGAGDDGGVVEREVPLPLLLVGVSIGIHVAAKWIRYRHLTWMIA
ncbi:hypothetical protein QJS10_CPA01g01135 [Acorus calamus]|uniref:Uncharacterized protein n=1 Tax=Acorus calamus TaxID=4465 RepID=A0AAV9FIS3_ACOCL|nr:hypothetical protein QJS10_CPA01g01135 [Acorus calamus]